MDSTVKATGHSNNFTANMNLISNKILCNLLLFIITLIQSWMFLCPIYGHCVFRSVQSFVRLSRFRLKFLVEVVFDEIEIQSTESLVHMFPMM